MLKLQITGATVHLCLNGDFDPHKVPHTCGLELFFNDTSSRFGLRELD